MKENRAAILVSLLLFFLPFFWFVPGAMDLGGDGSRLYFYDPVAFIKHVGLYSLNPEGKAEVNPSNHAYLPYVLLIAGINYITHSPSTVISIFNGLKLSVGFLSIYFIVKEFIGVGRREEVPAILAGVFYTVASGSEKLIFHWVKSLHSHDQIFLNPLVFFLLLRYLLTRNRWYLLGCILVSFIFSTSFSMISAPPFFAFYPLALTFLLLYVTLIRKIKIPFKEISISLLFFWVYTRFISSQSS